jgi:hypothetical protein
VTKFRLLLRRRRVAVVARSSPEFSPGGLADHRPGRPHITTWRRCRSSSSIYAANSQRAVINQAAQQATIGDVPTAARRSSSRSLRRRSRRSALAAVESGTIEIKARDTNRSRPALRAAFVSVRREQQPRTERRCHQKFDATKKRGDEAKAASMSTTHSLQVTPGRHRSRGGDSFPAPWTEDAWRTATGEL